MRLSSSLAYGVSATTSCARASVRTLSGSSMSSPGLARCRTAGRPRSGCSQHRARVEPGVVTAQAAGAAMRHRAREVGAGGVAALGEPPVARAGELRQSRRERAQLGELRVPCGERTEPYRAPLSRRAAPAPAARCASLTRAASTAAARCAGSAAPVAAAAAASTAASSATMSAGAATRYDFTGNR